jgi:hypothetical protein
VVRSPGTRGATGVGLRATGPGGDATPANREQPALSPLQPGARGQEGLRESGYGLRARRGCDAGKQANNPLFPLSSPEPGDKRGYGSRATGYPHLPTPPDKDWIFLCFLVSRGYQRPAAWVSGG